MQVTATAKIEGNLTTRLVVNMANEATQEVNRLADEQKTAYRGDVLRGHNSQRFANTWRSEGYPKIGRRESLSPAIQIWSKAPVLIEAFDLGVTIHPRLKKTLAVPTSDAPKASTRSETVTQADGTVRTKVTRLGRHNLVAQAAQKYGGLEYVPPERGADRKVAGYLFAQVRRTASGRVRVPSARQREAGQTDRILLFTLLWRAKMPKTLNVDAIHNQSIEKFRARMPAAYERGIKRSEISDSTSV